MEMRIEVRAQRIEGRDAAPPQHFAELAMDQLDASPVGLRLRRRLSRQGALEVVDASARRQ